MKMFLLFSTDVGLNQPPEWMFAPNVLYRLRITIGNDVRFSHWTMHCTSSSEKAFASSRHFIRWTLQRFWGFASSWDQGTKTSFLRKERKRNETRRSRNHKWTFKKDEGKRSKRPHRSSTLFAVIFPLDLKFQKSSTETKKDALLCASQAKSNWFFAFPTCLTRGRKK